MLWLNLSPLVTTRTVLAHQRRMDQCVTKMMTNYCSAVGISMAEKAAKKRDRLTIDFSNLRDRIEVARADAAWNQLSLNKKIQVLLEVRLDAIEAEQATSD